MLADQQIVSYFQKSLNVHYAGIQTNVKYLEI